MQNAYASKGGYLDLAGFDISGAAKVIANTKAVLETARAAGMTVIFFQNGWDCDYVEAGGPGSPNYHKSNALKTMRKRPELQGKLLARGGWDYELVDELKPQPATSSCTRRAIPASSIRSSTSVLRSRGIRHLVFTGIATNVCVESHPARRLLPRILRRRPRRRHPPGGPGLRAEGRHLQHRDILRLGLQRRRLQGRVRAAERKEEQIHAQESHPSARHAHADRPVLAGYAMPTASSTSRARWRSTRTTRSSSRATPLRRRSTSSRRSSRSSKRPAARWPTSP